MRLGSGARTEGWILTRQKISSQFRFLVHFCYNYLLETEYLFQLRLMIQLLIFEALPHVTTTIVTAYVNTAHGKRLTKLSTSVTVKCLVFYGLSAVRKRHSLVTAALWMHNKFLNCTNSIAHVRPQKLSYKWDSLYRLVSCEKGS